MQHFKHLYSLLEVYPIFLICFWITPVQSICAAWFKAKFSLISEARDLFKKQLSASRRLNITCMSDVKGPPLFNRDGTPSCSIRKSCAVRTFYLPHSVPKGASQALKRTSSSHNRKRNKEKKRVNVTQFGSCK